MKLFPEIHKALHGKGEGKEEPTSIVDRYVIAIYKGEMESHIIKGPANLSETMYRYMSLPCWFISCKIKWKGGGQPRRRLSTAEFSHFSSSWTF